MRSCKYTATPKTNRRQTIPFQWKDVQLWDNTSRLSMFLPYAELVERCTVVTLCLVNQKLGRQGAPITHHKLDDDHPAADVCPVKAVLRQLRNSQKHPNFQCHIISTYVTKKNNLATISARTVTAALKRCVKMLKLDKIGIYDTLVSTHSLRLGGAGRCCGTGSSCSRSLSMPSSHS